MGDASALAIVGIDVSLLAIETEPAIGNRITVMSKPLIKQEARCLLVQLFLFWAKVARN